MSLLFVTPTSALYIACLEPRLAKWREKEGLIKFIMNCRRVHKGGREGVCSNVRRHGALSNFHTPRRPFFIHFNLAPFRNDFQDRSLAARRRRDTISVVRPFFCELGISTRAYRAALIRVSVLASREALVNAKIIEIARSSSLWRADDMPSYKLCLFQFEMFLFPVPFGAVC